MISRAGHIEIGHGRCYSQAMNEAQRTTGSANAGSPPEAALALARDLVKRFYASCFWFRHPEASLDSSEDVYLVITHLREYGNHAAWSEAQRLWKCL